MAILVSEEYVKCRECNGTQFRSENRGLLRDNGTSYVLETNKCIVCCECGKIHDSVGRFSGKILIER